MLTQRELLARQRIVDNAIANQKLEGLSLDSDTLSDAKDFIAGRIESSELVHRAKRRVEDEIRK